MQAPVHSVSYLYYIKFMHLTSVGTRPCYGKRNMSVGPDLIYLGTSTILALSFFHNHCMKNLTELLRTAPVMLILPLRSRRHDTFEMAASNDLRQDVFCL